MTRSNSLNSEDRDPFEEYLVVLSLHGDYSIWPAIRTIPNGWKAIGVQGSRDNCLEWIQANWDGPKIK